MIFDALFGSDTKRLSGTANPDQWLVDWVRGGSMTSAGETVNEETALTCAAVYAAVRILSETVASLPLEVFERLPDGGKRPAYDHPLYRVLHDEPNPEQSSYIWRETAQGHLCTWGNAYHEIQRDLGDRPIRLWPISPKPQRMKPYRDTDNQIRYEHRPETGGGPEHIEARDVLHIPGFGFDGLIGKSPISLMKEPIGSAKAMERYSAELFANSAAHEGVLQSPGKLSDKAYGRLQEANAELAEHGKRHRKLILEEGTQFAATNMRPEDVQLIMARRFSVEEIARAYRISLHLLQEFTEGAASYSSIVELGKEFIEFTMLPWLKRWQAEINRKLLDGKHFCEFNVGAFLEGDPTAQAELFFKGFQVGLFSINDMLRERKQNPIGPEGDVRFVPRNLQPLDQAIKAEPEKKQPPPPVKDEGREEKGEEREGEEEKPEEKFSAALAGLRQEYDEIALGKQKRCEQAAQQVIREVMQRMLHKEQNAACRAAKHPDRFVDWIDTFYPGHQATLAQALHNPLAMLIVAQDRQVDVSDAAARMAQVCCDRSQELLLNAAECRPAELADRVTEACASIVSEWTDALADAANRLQHQEKQI